MKKNSDLFRCSVIIWMASILTIVTACSGMSAKRAVVKEKKGPKIRFLRALTEKGGKGGFAYQGLREKYEIEDTLLSAVDSTPQPSEWFSSEKAFYLNLLKDRSFEVLVVPFQTQMDGVDPIGRSLMSYRLAAEIEKKTDLRVAPLPLVHIALGSHSRFYTDTDIFALARQLNVSHIVWGFTGTREDKAGHVQSLDITMVCQKREAFGSAEGARSKSWSGMDLSKNQLPYHVFEGELKHIMSFIDLPGPKAVQKMGTLDAQPPSIPQTPEALFRSSTEDPIAKSYMFQFMGMLIPPKAEFHRQYMFIRSLIALSGADKNHPDYAVLSARAYHHLNRRPAAIAALGKDKSDRARFLRNMINGNLSNFDNIRSQLTAPTLDGFMATVEYTWLMDRYTDKMPTKHMAHWIDAYPHWTYFFEAILNAENGWHIPSNWELKQILDREYPIGQLAVERSIKKLLALIQAQLADSKLDTSFQDHLWESLQKRSASAISGSHTDGPGILDHHLFLEGVGISNLLTRLYYIDSVQCLPEKSMELCKIYLQRYKGHPYFTLIYANMQKNAAITLQGEEKEKVLLQSRQDASMGLWWYGRQGWAFPKAYSALRKDINPKSKSIDLPIPGNRLVFGIASDYPFISRCARRGFIRPYVDLIDWSSWDITY